MNSVLEKYFFSKEKEIYKYVTIINNMFFYDIDITIDNKELKKIINIYITDDYKVINPSLNTVLKYYEFEEEIDTEYKCILNSTIKYYEDKETIENNEKIFYISYLIYFAVLLDKLKDTIIIMPNKVEFIISIANKVSTKLKFERNDNFEKNASLIVSLLKENIKSYNKLKNSINKSVNKDFYNDYVLLNSNYNLYKIKNVQNIKGLSKYKEKDIKKICEKENIEDRLILLAYSYSQIMLLKCLLNGERNAIALEVSKKFYKRKSNINNLLKLICNKYAKDYTKILIKSDDYEECEELDKFKENNIKIIIECNSLNEIDNIKFDENMVLLTSEEIINQNKLDFDSKNIKYINKMEEKIVKESEFFILKSLDGGNNE